LAAPSMFGIIRVGIVAASGLLCCAVLLAPLLSVRSDAMPAGLIYLFFSPVCHQLPDRSFLLHGQPWAVCQRCSGIYGGLLIGSLVPGRRMRMPASPSRRRAWVLLFCGALATDAALSWLTGWPDSPLLRFVTGLLFGIMLAWLLVWGLAEWVAGRRPSVCAPDGSISSGGSR